MQTLNRQYGLTLVELMITLAVLGIFATIAVPSFNSFMQNNKLLATSNELASLMQIARSIAAEKNASTIICESSGEWSVRSKGGTSDPCDGTVLRNFTQPADLTVRSSSNALPITFNSTGSAGSSRAFTVCKGSDAASGYKLTVEASGNVRLLAKGKTNVAGAALTTCTL